MAGRPRTPAERPIHMVYRNPEAFMSRIQRAVIMDVNESDGTCTIAYDNTMGERPGVTLPFYVHFGRKKQRRKAAWSRFMPQPGDYVLVGFDSNAEARIVGHEPVNYNQLASIQEDEGKFLFSDLKGGEFDMRSSGAAYLKGDVVGTLFLAGGMSSMLLDKKNYEIRVNTGRVKETLGTSVFRRGVVKRSPIPFQPELPAKATVGVLPIDKLGPASAAFTDLYEFTADIRAAANPSSPLAQKVALFSVGNVLDPTFSLPVVGDAYAAAATAGIMKFKINPVANARLLLRIYDSVPISDTPVGTEGPIGGTPARPFEWGVDQLGNSYMNVGSLATQGFNIWSTTQISLSSNLLQLSGNVFLGGTPVPVVPGGPAILNSGIANQPLVCGFLFNAALATYVTAVATFAGIAAGGSAVSSPGDAVLYCKALGTAGAVLATAASGFAAAAATPAWLSASVFCAPSALGIGVIPPLSPFLL
jgi:hypothetical protein